MGSLSVHASVSAYYTEPLVIFSSNVNATADVGGSFNFSCNASNFNVLQWIFYDLNNSYPRVVSNTTDGRRVITPDNELHLTNIQFEDEGIYECRLSNYLKRMSIRNRLLIVTGEQKKKEANQIIN